MQSIVFFFWKKTYQILSFIWYVPFGFYRSSYRKTRVRPHGLTPRNLRDLTLNKMMFPDNILRAVVADKIAVRGWIAEKVGQEYLIPLVDVCEQPEDLTPHKYPLPVVVKSNHASGQVEFILEPNDWDRLGINTKAKGWLANVYSTKREWVYWDIDRKLMVEKMLLDEQGRLPADIKCYCFFGQPVLIVNTQTVNGVERYGSTVKHFLSSNWERIDICDSLNSKSPLPKKPDDYEEMLKIASTLSAPFDYIRVDMFYCNGKIYIGEITNFDAAGRFVHTPHEYDAYLLKEYKRIRAEKIAQMRSTYTELGTKEFP